MPNSSSSSATRSRSFEESDEEELVEFVGKLRVIMDKAEAATRTTLAALNELEASIQHAEANMADFFREMEMRERRLRNLRTTQSEFETVLAILDHLDHDRLRLVHGPTSMPLDEYVAKLEFVKSLDQFAWLGQYKCAAGYLAKLGALMAACDRILANEFTDLLRHFSSLDLMERYLEFIVDEFDASIETADRESARSRLLIPRETLEKMKIIAAWFLKREQDYELYDENNEHCDINTRLRYNDIRLPFLKSVILTYSKINSLGFIKDSSKERIKNGINKLLNAAIATPTQHLNSIGSLMTSIAFAPSVSPSPAANFQTIGIKRNHLASGGAESEADKASSTGSRDSAGERKAFSKPVECIEVFADNLDFCLKLLKHETLILSALFSDSEETLGELTSKSTITVIDLIQTEFEKFLTDMCDFTKTSNSGDDVVVAIIMLVKKVQHLKEKACCLQSEDLSSAAKFLSFSMRLNEISAQVFGTYIDAIRTGHFSEFSMPSNCSIHERTARTCETLERMNADQAFLIDSLRIVFETRLNRGRDSEKEGERIEEEAELKDEESNGEEEAAAEEEEVEEEDELQANDLGPIESEPSEAKSKSKKLFKGIRRLKRLRDRLRNSSCSNGSNEDAEVSNKIYFVRYAEVVIQRLHHYFSNEILKEHKNLSQLSASVSLASAKMPALSVFQTLKETSMVAIRTSFRKCKSYIFFLNNVEYMIDSLEHLSLLASLKETGSGLEVRLNKTIQECIDKACEIFRLLEKKWKLIAPEVLFMVPATAPAKSRGSLFRKFSISSEPSIKPVAEAAPGQEGATNVQSAEGQAGEVKAAMKLAVKVKNKKYVKFVKGLREILEDCSNIVIYKPGTNAIFRQLVIHHLEQIMDALHSTEHLDELGPMSLPPAVEEQADASPPLVASKQAVYERLFVSP